MIRAVDGGGGRKRGKEVNPKAIIGCTNPPSRTGRCSIDGEHLRRARRVEPIAENLIRPHLVAKRIICSNLDITSGDVRVTDTCYK